MALRNVSIDVNILWLSDSVLLFSVSTFLIMNTAHQGLIACYSDVGGSQVTFKLVQMSTTWCHFNRTTDCTVWHPWQKLISLTLWNIWSYWFKWHRSNVQWHNIHTSFHENVGLEFKLYDEVSSNEEDMLMQPCWNRWK